MGAIDTIRVAKAPDTAGSRFARLFRAIRSYHFSKRQLRRSRLHLFELSDAELQDIGLTREVADREAARSLLACYLNNSR